jgi:hypothetical protein
MLAPDGFYCRSDALFIAPCCATYSAFIGQSWSFFGGRFAEIYP